MTEFRYSDLWLENFGDDRWWMSGRDMFQLADDIAALKKQNELMTNTIRDLKDYINQLEASND